MASISGKETQPEIIVRRELFNRGFRYRKNVSTLPGKPDIVLAKYNSIILIHGCFWHGHSCNKGTRPTSNSEFWNLKIEKNKDRDQQIKNKLEALGWKVLIVWTCELKNNEIKEKTINNLVSDIKQIRNNYY